MRLAAHLDRNEERAGALRTLLAITSIAAGVIHAAVVPEHLSEAWIFGAFFILVAGFQIAWAIPVLFGPSAIAYSTGLIASGTLIGIWAISRTIGLPIGPDAWTPEPTGVQDITATLLELFLVAGSLTLGPRRAHARRAAVRDRLGKEHQTCA